MSWTNEQLDAINHKDSDLIISAAAGSGKTTTLTERIIRKIKAGADISKMLIVTFTNAAASELKNKICKMISDELKSSPSSKHLSAQLIKASCADICTIDSFCYKLVRANFDKLLLDGNFRIGEKSELEILDLQTMEEIIDEYYESDEKDEDFLLVADCYSSIWSEQELAKALLSLRRQLLSTANGLNTLLELESYDSSFMNTQYGAVLRVHIKETAEHFIPIYSDAIKLLSKSKVGLDYYVPFIQAELDYIKRINRSLNRGDDYDKLRSIIHDYTFEKPPQKKLEDDIDISLFRALRSNAKKAFTEIKDDYFAADEVAVLSSLKQNKIICRAIYNILDTFEKRLQKKKRLLSVYSFNDISNFALKLLYNDDYSIASDLSKKYQEVYIDEYQDTNSVQDKIFRAFSTNKRFMVGDIKQSIYRFRSAEPEIFSYYRLNFSKSKNFDKSTSLGKSIFMSTNFRCDKNVIDFSNLISDYMFKNSKGIPYEDEDKLGFPNDKEERPAKCEIHLLDNAGFGRKDTTENQADYVAKMISEMIKNEKHPATGKKIKRDNIAILLRKSDKQIPIYVKALQKYGINAIYKTNDDLFDKPHIMLALCILNAIDNPSKDIYLAGAMRSDVFGFSLSDLVKIKKQIKASASLYSTLNSYNLEDELQEKISAFLTRLAELKASIKRMNSYDAISYVYGSCGLLSMCNSEERADFMKLYNIAREFEGNSYKGLFSFLRYIDTLSQDYDAREFKGDVTKESVKLMSIHASKGLEFDICFVCGIENTFSHQDITSSLLFQRELGVAGMVGQKDGLARFEPLIRKCISIKKIREMHEEEMRILYVAMTRAKHKLILTGCASNPKALREFYVKERDYVSPYDLYTSSSFLKYVLGGISYEHPCYSVFYNGIKENENVKSEKKKKPIRKKIEQYKETFKKRFGFEYEYGYLEKIPSKMSVSRLYPEVLDEQNMEISIPELASVPKFLATSEEKITAAQKGIATHVFMQFCDFKMLISNGFDTELKRLVDEGYISEADSLLVNKRSIEEFMRSELFARILNAKKVYREFRFNVMLDASEFTSDERLKDESVLVQGVTDCIFITKDDRLVLVDYKTDYVTFNNYENELKEKYTSQLTYYKKACRLMFSKDVDEALIYSVPMGKTVEI